MTEGTPTRIGFVCVQNAGRSQMAYAFARCELDARDIEDRFDVVTGGTRPAERLHPEVVEAMQAVGIDIADRSPREVSVEELRECDYVITMGCSAEDVCPGGWGGESRDWGLDDPDGRSREDVAVIREEIKRRVKALLDELS